MKELSDLREKVREMEEEKNMNLARNISPLKNQNSSDPRVRGTASTSVFYPAVSPSSATATATAVISIGPDSLVHKARVNAKTSLEDNYNTDYSYTKYDNNFEEANDRRCSNPSYLFNNTTATVTGARTLPWHGMKSEVGCTDALSRYLSMTCRDPRSNDST